MLLGVLVQPYVNLDIVQILCILVNKVIVYECEHIIVLYGTETARLFVIECYMFIYKHVTFFSHSMHAALLPLEK